LNRIIENAESGLLEGKTPALGAVDVQNILKEITDKNDMEVLTMRVMKPENKEEDIYMIIPVQITIRCSVRQLKEVIYQIESSSRLLRISDCRIRVIRGRVEGQVQATLTVQGFMKKYD
jgi:Tfp pilus assembly protein PilO